MTVWLRIVLGWLKSVTSSNMDGQIVAMKQLEELRRS
jgi:hypothetical protein